MKDKPSARRKIEDRISFWLGTTEGEKTVKLGLLKPSLVLDRPLAENLIGAICHAFRSIQQPLQTRPARAFLRVRTKLYTVGRLGARRGKRSGKSGFSRPQPKQFSARKASAKNTQ